jgi:hypothetical protein
MPPRNPGSVFSLPPNPWNPSDPDVFRSQPTGSAGGSARFRVTAKESRSG